MLNFFYPRNEQYFYFIFVSSKLYLIRPSVFPFVGIVIQNNGHARIFYSIIYSVVYCILDELHLFQCYSWCSTQCLISPYLFLLCAEIMGIANRRSEDIRGLKFKFKELKLFQYGQKARYFI
jgi:hypothetical protein